MTTGSRLSSPSPAFPLPLNAPQPQPQPTTPTHNPNPQPQPQQITHGDAPPDHLGHLAPTPGAAAAGGGRLLQGEPAAEDRCVERGPGEVMSGCGWLGGCGAMSGDGGMSGCGGMSVCHACLERTNGEERTLPCLLPLVVHQSSANNTFNVNNRTATGSRWGAGRSGL